MVAVLLNIVLGTFAGCGIILTVVGGISIYRVTHSTLSSQLSWFVSLMILMLTVGVLLDIMALMQWKLNKNLQKNRRPPRWYSAVSIILMISIMVMQVRKPIFLTQLPKPLADLFSFRFIFFSFFFSLFLSASCGWTGASWSPDSQKPGFRSHLGFSGHKGRISIVAVGM